jgi:hypothetical protein
MCHSALLDSNFYSLLLRIDEDEAAKTRASGCIVCGGVLHSARYPRKPRGGPGDLSKACRFRRSFCCAICDKRHKPVSVLFLSRRVYLAAVVVLASALRSGLSGRRTEQLTGWIGVPKCTLERWRAWWLHDFATARGRGSAGLSGGAVRRCGSRLTTPCGSAFSGPALRGTLTRCLAPAEDGDRIGIELRHTLLILS